MDSKDIFIDIDNFTFAEDEIDSGNYAHVFLVKEKKKQEEHMQPKNLMPVHI